MAAIFLAVTGQVATLFMLMGVGFALRKKQKLSEGTLSQMTFLLLYVVTPFLIVDAMQIPRSGETVRMMGYTLLGGVIFFAFAILMSRFFFRKSPPDTRDVLRFGSIYTNSGFMGLPLVRAVLGDGAVLYAAVFLVVMALIHWTHGAKLMDKSGKIPLKSALFNPGTIGFLAGTLLFALDFRLPSPVANATGFIASLNTPVAMIIIGAQMADAELPKLFRVRELYVAAALKLVAFPVVTALLILPMRFPPLIYCAVVILAATPSAGVTSMFAQRFERDTVTAARCVSFVTLLSVATLPVFASVAQVVAGL